MDSDSSSRRSRLRDLDEGGEDIEEGEYVPGRDEASDDSDSDTDDDEELCGLQRRLEGELGRRVSWLEVVMASGRVAPSPPSWESDGTISDGGGSPSAAASSAISAGAPAPSFACHVCGRRFRSPKAVDGHMRVHGSGRQVAAVSGGWAATGKRGWTGGKPSSVAVSLNSESADSHSTAVVAVRPLELEPMPMAIAVTSPPATPVAGTNLSGEESSSASAQPMHYEPPVATAVVTLPNPSSTGVVVHQHAAPPHAAEQARPVHQPAVPPPLAAQQAQLVRHPLAPPRERSAPQPAREYSCKQCGKSYPTHQGLGGHAAGHKTRQKEAEAAAAAAAAIMMGQEDGGAFLAAFRRGRRAQATHECRKCHKVFPTGVALGGHMRMHYTGPPIVHRKNKRRALVSEADLRLALSTATPPPPAPAVAGRVRLFGIDIGPQAQAPSPPPEEQGSSGTAEGSSSAESEQE